MSKSFHVYGPFQFKKELIANKTHTSAVWEEVDAKYIHLSKAKGVYLVSLRNGKNYKPVYVGITKNQSFRKEVFNSSNAVKILTRKQVKGTLCVHLLAKPKPSHRGYSINISKQILVWVEVMLLFSCLQKNEKMWNKSHTVFLKGAQIDKITVGWSKGKPSRTISTFLNAIGW